MDRIRILGIAFIVFVFCFVATGASAEDWQYNLGTAPEGPWVRGYMKLTTPIDANEGNMFSIKIIGNRYGSGGTPVEIRCNGYAYRNTGLIQTDCHTEGTNDPVGIGVDANNKVIITIGSVECSNRWFCDHFNIEYLGWIPKQQEDFTWEFVYNEAPPTVNTNNVCVDDSAGTITTTGNVGVGTPNPLYKPYVHGGEDGVVSFFGGAESSGIQGLYVMVGQNAGHESEPHLVTLKSSGVSAGPISLGTGNSEVMRITPAGNVGVGTPNPDSNYKLDVNGPIKAKEIKVTVASVDEVKVNDAQWSDFVFEDGYKLPTLDHVESYIKENKHLPDVPSAKQISEDGLSMAKMMAKQMQKIEELTLYVIELKKQNEKLAEISTDLVKEKEQAVLEMKMLKARIANLEATE